MDNNTSPIDVTLSDGKVFRFKANRSYILAFDKKAFDMQSAEELSEALKRTGITNITILTLDGNPEQLMRMFEKKGENLEA